MYYVAKNWRDENVNKVCANEITIQEFFAKFLQKIGRKFSTTTSTITFMTISIGLIPNGWQSSGIVKTMKTD